MGRDLNKYTLVLFLAGCAGAIYTLVKSPAEISGLALFVTAVCVTLDAFPLRLSNGLTWTGGVIGAIFISWHDHLSSGLFAYTLSTFISFTILCFRYRRKFLPYRLLSTLGMYYISLLTSYAGMRVLHGFPVILVAVCGMGLFEFANLCLMVTLERSLGSHRVLRDVFSQVHVFPILFATLAVWRLMWSNVPQGQLSTELVWSSIMLVLVFMMSNRFVKISSAKQKSDYDYQIIATHTSDLIAVVRPNACIVYLSPSHDKICTGAPRHAEGIAYTAYLKTFFLSDSVDYLADKIQEAVRTKTVQSAEVESTDVTCLLESVISPVTGRDGQVSHLVIVSRDITERRQAEELLNRSDKLAIVGQLAAGVAHEIRNPLTALKGFVQLFQPYLKEKEQLYSVMWNELERIEEIINEFLLLAKPQEGERKQVRDLRELITQVAQLIETHANMSAIRVHLDLGSEPLSVLCHGNQIKQVFINLMKNAVESMPQGGTLTVSATTSNHTISIQVQDSGAGIEHVLLSKLGEPFYTTKEKGTGLGLMVSNKIIQDHYGSILFDSELGKGTKVVVQLPKGRGHSSTRDPSSTEEIFSTG